MDRLRDHRHGDVDRPVGVALRTGRFTRCAVRIESSAACYTVPRRRELWPAGERSRWRTVVRTLSLAAAAAQLAGAPSQSVAADADTPTTPSYSFRLTRGMNTPVCKAFAKRLNTAEFKAPPACGIPESDSVRGFEKLTRVPLSSAEVGPLYPRVETFMHLGKQYAQSDWPTADALFRLGENVFVWRYEPPVSLNNNSEPDNVVIWQGLGVDDFSGDETCGSDTFAGGQLVKYEARQVGFVLTPDGARIDEAKTRALFGHPSGVAGEATRVGTSEGGFGPYGDSEGIIKYRGQYYLETFYSRRTGDLYGRRRVAAIGDVLAVLLRKDGVTHVMCEYEMSASGSDENAASR